MYRADLVVYRAFLSVYRADLGVYRAFLSVYRADLGVYRHFLIVYWADLGVFGACSVTMHAAFSVCNTHTHTQTQTHTHTHKKPPVESVWKRILACRIVCLYVYVRMHTHSYFCV